MSQTERPDKITTNIETNLQLNEEGMKKLLSERDDLKEKLSMANHVIMLLAEKCNGDETGDEMGEQQTRIDALTNDLRYYREMNETLQTTVEQMREQAAETEKDMKSLLSDCYRLDTEQKDMIQALKQELVRVKSSMVELEKDYQRQIDAMVSQQSIEMDSLKLQLNENFAKEITEQLALQKEQASRELVPRTDLNEQIRLNHEIEKRLADNETLLQLIQEQLAKKNQDIDELTQQTSKTVLERTQFMSERDHFEKMYRDLKEKYDSLATECSELHSRLANADLRTPNRSKVDLNKSFTNILMEGDGDLKLMTAPSAAVIPMKSLSKSNMLIVPHDCEKVDKENVELRRKIDRIHNVLASSSN